MKAGAPPSDAPPKRKRKTAPEPAVLLPPVSPEELQAAADGLHDVLASFVGIRPGAAPEREGGILYAGEAKLICMCGARVMAKHGASGIIGDYMSECLLVGTVVAVVVREIVAAFRAPPADAGAGGETGGTEAPGADTK